MTEDRKYGLKEDWIDKRACKDPACKCQEPELCGDVSESEGFVCTRDKGHDDYHENGHGMVWYSQHGLPEGQVNPCCCDDGAGPKCADASRCMFDSTEKPDADADIAAGRITRHETGEDFLKSLEDPTQCRECGKYAPVGRWRDRLCPNCRTKEATDDN